MKWEKTWRPPIPFVIGRFPFDWWPVGLEKIVRCSVGLKSSTLGSIYHTVMMRAIGVIEIRERINCLQWVMGDEQGRGRVWLHIYKNCQLDHNKPLAYAGEYARWNICGMRRYARLNICCVQDACKVECTWCAAGRATNNSQLKWSSCKESHQSVIVSVN